VRQHTEGFKKHCGIDVEADSQLTTGSCSECVYLPPRYPIFLIGKGIVIRPVGI